MAPAPLDSRQIFWALRLMVARGGLHLGNDSPLQTQGMMIFHQLTDVVSYDKSTNVLEDNDPTVNQSPPHASLKSLEALYHTAALWMIGF